MTINGEPKLSCHAFLRDYRGMTVQVEPLDHFPIERDLVVVIDGFLDKLASVKPYLIAKNERPLSEGVYDLRQTQAQLTKQEDPQSVLWQAKVSHYRPLIERIIAQSERRVLKGEQVPACEKLVSLFEAHADIIVKGGRDTS